MDQIQHGACNDFLNQFYNNLLKGTGKNNENKNVQNIFETFSNNSSKNISNKNISDNKTKQKVHKYNVYEEKILNDALLSKEMIKAKKNGKEINVLQQEITNNFLLNSENKNNENLILESQKKNYLTFKEPKEPDKDYNNININNAICNLNGNYYQKYIQKLYNNKKNLNVNVIEDHMLINTYGNIFSSDINSKSINKINFEMDNNKEIYNNNIDTGYQILLNSTSIKNDYNQFLKPNVITENSMNKNLEDPNSEENLKKIEQQINLLLFSSKNSSNNSTKENSNNSNEKLYGFINNDDDDDFNNKKSENKNFHNNNNNNNNNNIPNNRPLLSRLVSQLDSLAEISNNYLEVNNQKGEIKEHKAFNKNYDNSSKSYLKNNIINRNIINKNGKADNNNADTHLKKTYHKKNQEKIITENFSQINKWYSLNEKLNKEKINSDKCKNLKKENSNTFKKSDDNNLNEVILTESENLKFKNYKRKSFDEYKFKGNSSKVDNTRNSQLKQRHSFANIKMTEKIISQDFYFELTDAINKTVDEIKAKPIDLKKREILFKYIKSVAKKVFPGKNNIIAKYNFLQQLSIFTTI
ncbi:hypothetical protein BCR36DRAFT_85699 [Piromyces finnis]|uniref:Uncharacterized protein n=1 Tax=Piromyces finnis TaxID=1754191 RepID=A0A1Y1V5Q3_9FUNG|nr:hypothetical protein BCR36DRAFT_85699 [Piromyces finnis]|eukprot:ORX47881.1 hypothetical protein BCR36DRAFT_85699 [Piromyces finnis]